MYVISSCYFVVELVIIMSRVEFRGLVLEVIGFVFVEECVGGEG